VWSGRSQPYRSCEITASWRRTERERSFVRIRDIVKAAYSSGSGEPDPADFRARGIVSRTPSRIIPPHRYRADRRNRNRRSGRKCSRSKRASLVMHRIRSKTRAATLSTRRKLRSPEAMRAACHQSRHLLRRNIEGRCVVTSEPMRSCNGARTGRKAQPSVLTSRT